jgi:hypothetical protein
MEHSHYVGVVAGGLCTEIVIGDATEDGEKYTINDRNILDGGCQLDFIITRGDSRRDRYHCIQYRPDEG